MVSETVDHIDAKVDDCVGATVNATVEDSGVLDSVPSTRDTSLHEPIDTDQETGPLPMLISPLCQKY